MTSSSLDSSTTMPHHYHHHSHHHHHPRRWAKLQQRIRRNCLVGPVTVFLLVILGTPYLYTGTDGTGSGTHSLTGHDLANMVLHYSVPVVEAVPFFRRANKVFGVHLNNLIRNNKGGQQQPDKESVTEDGEEEEVDQPEEDTSSTTSTTTATATVEPPTKKQKVDSPSKAQYNFQLFPDQDSFESDPTAPIPFRYLDAHSQRQDAARKATLESLHWRHDNSIDTILSRSNPNYDIAKRILPHYFVGTSPVTNHVVFIQRPGLSDLELAKHNHVTIQDMLLQYAFVFEYCWNILHDSSTSATDPDALMIGILDMQGLNLSVLRKPELINFVKEFVGMIDAHYPTRAYKTFMVNAPQWFSALYKLVSPIMRETTKEKIVLYSAGNDQDAALVEALGEEMAATVQTALRIPTKKEQRQKNKYDLSLTSDILLETDMEKEIRSFVTKQLDQDGIAMKPIVPLDQPKPPQP